MTAQMLLQIMVDFKDLRTLGTAKGTLTSMSAYMRQEMGVLRKSSWTVWTPVRICIRHFRRVSFCDVCP